MDESGEPDLEDLIRRERRRQRLADLSRRTRPEGGELDPTMPDLVADQFAGEPLFVTLRLARPDGASVTARVHNDQELLAHLAAHDWVERPQE